MKKFLWLDNIQENIENKFNSFILWLKEYRQTFLFSFLVGIIINIGVFIYNLGNGDTIKWAIYQENFWWERVQGRWLLQAISMFRNDKVIPIFITILSLIFIACATVVIVDIFKLKNKVFVGIFSILMMASPFVNSYLYIYYTSDAYCLGVLIASVAAWLLITKRDKISLFLAAALIMCSLAIYQAMLNVIVCLCVISFFIRTLDNIESIAEQMKYMLRCLIGGITGLIMYICSLKVILTITGETMADYKGMNEIGHYSLDIIVGMFKNYWKHINLMYFEVNGHVSSSEFYSQLMPGTLINICVVILILAIIVHLICKNRVFCSKKNIAWFSLNGVLLLMGWSIIIFASTVYSIEEAPLNSLISPQFSFLYLLAFVLCEKDCEARYNFLTRISLSILTTMMCFNLTLAINEVYYGNQLAWNQAQTLAIRIVDRMEQTEGWYSGMPVMFVGSFDGNISENYPRINEVIRGSNLPYMWEGQIQLGWNKFLIMYMGVEYEMYGDGFGSTFSEYPEYQEMDIFPAENSIKVIDGVMVIKLSEY